MANLYGYRESFGNVVTLATDQIVQGTKRFRSFDNNYNGNLVDVQTIVCKGQCDVVGNLIAQNNMNVNGTLSVSGNETVTGVLTATNAGSRVTLANKIVTEGRDDAVQYYIPFVASKDSAPNGQTLFTDNGATGAHLGFNPSTNTLAIGNSGGANGKIEVVGTSSSLTIAGTGTALSVSGTATIAGAGTALNLSAGGLTVAGSIQTSTGVLLPTTYTLANFTASTLGYNVKTTTNVGGTSVTSGVEKVLTLGVTYAPGVYLIHMQLQLNSNSAAGYLRYVNVGVTAGGGFGGEGTGQIAIASSSTFTASASYIIASTCIPVILTTSQTLSYRLVTDFSGFTIVVDSTQNYYRIVRIA